MRYVATLILAFIVSPSSALSDEYAQFGEIEPYFHGGGTDKCGCHYNRKTGVYHCHTRKKRGGDCPP